MAVYDDSVQALIPALELRSLIKMIRAPDGVLDHLLAGYLKAEVHPYTGDLDWAREWVRLVAPDLTILDPVQVGRGLFGIEVRLRGQPHSCWLAAEHPAIPACFAGLNRRIDLIILDLGPNNSPEAVDKAEPGR